MNIELLIHMRALDAIMTDVNWIVDDMDTVACSKCLSLVRKDVVLLPRVA